MPAPTKNPKPTPKPPPVCASPKTKFICFKQAPEDRILTANVTGLLTQSGLPTSFNVVFPIRPWNAPDIWLGELTLEPMLIEVILMKLKNQDLYRPGLSFAIGPTPFYDEEWNLVKPLHSDPLRLPTLQKTDLLTGDWGSLTIMA